MDSAAPFKAAIKEIVATYKREYADEYKLVCEAVVMLRKAMDDPEFGEGEGDMRAQAEIPEVLENMIINRLSVDGIKWYKAHEGSRWFVKTFKEFSLTRRV